ncbi:hypothetical protein SCWH03_35410 [Streptomyces pacificus]|uniref:Uncharacterized protein n=1 Tax=Streptomyces pacificus TaxID=2705029 RepID=A0A6A0AY41_9ACTN|nr:hypothetical protein SCWH03_35410 [Streptomyces pacificus]
MGLHRGGHGWAVPRGEAPKGLEGAHRGPGGGVKGTRGGVKVLERGEPGMRGDRRTPVTGGRDDGGPRGGRVPVREPAPRPGVQGGPGAAPEVLGADAPQSAGRVLSECCADVSRPYHLCEPPGTVRLVAPAQARVRARCLRAVSPGPPRRARWGPRAPGPDACPPRRSGPLTVPAAPGPSRAGVHGPGGAGSALTAQVNSGAGSARRRT